MSSGYVPSSGSGVYELHQAPKTCYGAVPSLATCEQGRRGSPGAFHAFAVGDQMKGYLFAPRCLFCQPPRFDFMRTHAFRPAVPLSRRVAHGRRRSGLCHWKRWNQPSSRGPSESISKNGGLSSSFTKERPRRAWAFPPDLPVIGNRPRRRRCRRRQFNWTRDMLSPTNLSGQIQTNLRAQPA
jgi:hypothetical protein